jgi:hypothetical protein
MMILGKMLASLWWWGFADHAKHGARTAPVDPPKHQSGGQ